MHDDPLFFRSRAAAEQANADSADLSNVRERCQRAADSWTAMAVRAERTRTMRSTREAAAEAARLPAAE